MEQASHSTTQKRKHGGQKKHRISKSYTDITSQISGDHPNIKRHSRHGKSKPGLSTKTVDYAFLRDLLGINSKMGDKERTERFLSEELREAVLKLRGEVHSLKLEIKDENWLKTLEDLGDIKDMDLDLLEAMYMLRNAYKRGVFSSHPSFKNENMETEQEFCSSIEDSIKTNSSMLPTPELTINELAYHNRCTSPLSTASHISSDWSSDLESTTSSVNVKRRPAKPRIHLSSASLSELRNREEDFLALRASEFVLASDKNLVVKADSGSGADNERTGRPGSADSRTSYLNLEDELQGAKHQDEKTNENSEYLHLNTRPSEPELKIYEEFRSNSPTSCLLRPLFQHAMSSDIFKTLQSIRSELSPQLRRLENLENDAKLMPVLQVKLAVLQEEKRQLLNIIKQKRNIKQSISSYQSSNTSSPLQSLSSSPTTFMSDADDAIMVRPSPRRALATKETQTDDVEPSFKWLMCPYCLNKTLDAADDADSEGGSKKSENETDVCLGVEKIGNEFNSEDLNRSFQEIEIEVEKLKSEGDKNEIEDKMVLEELFESLNTAAVLHTVPNDEISNEKRDFVDVGVQSQVEQFDVETLTVQKSFENIAISAYPDVKAVGTETVRPCYSDTGSETTKSRKLFSDVCVQQDIDLVDKSFQFSVAYTDKTTMVGCSPAEHKGLQFSPSTKEASFGDDVVIRDYRDNETQDCAELSDRGTQMEASATADMGVMCGCAISACRSTATEAFVDQSDFECGDGFVNIETIDVATQNSAETCENSCSPIKLPVYEVSTLCNFDKKDSVTLGVGEDVVSGLACDACANRDLVSTCVGSYNMDESISREYQRTNSDAFCRTDDKLCSCTTPQTTDAAIGDKHVDEVVCDDCENKTYESAACGDGEAGGLLCDKCSNRQVESVACGDDDVNLLLCEACVIRGSKTDNAIGNDFDNNNLQQTGNMTSVGNSLENSMLKHHSSSNGVLNPISAELGPYSLKCNAEELYQNIDASTSIHHHSSEELGTHLQNTNTSLFENGGENDVCSEVYQIMVNSAANSDAAQHPVICNYCGNKVDVNEQYDELVKMREDFSAFKTSRLEGRKADEDGADFSRVEENLSHDDDESDEDEMDGYDISTRNDIVETCKMLQHHFSGERPLKQQLMLKYLANIESLWFQTVKRKRTNAAVVKSNIDLFQSRIPELVDTIINLMDEDGNTALHFALTYKNTGVVSILLDSNECQVNLVNKAGYSPVMLAALAGFDNKTDKYVMQRLLRAGEVNYKNKETGQTPLMLAVSRGNAGMVELLLDAGADVNETDNDGSTALMCACENGSMAIVKALLSNPDCDSTIEDHEGSTALTIAMDAKRRDLALLIYGSLNFDMRGRIKLTPSKQSLLGLGVRRSPSPVIGKM